ncbi:OmcA/MtrC family decaheme c-type cytochrome [Shewanella sp. 0m-8]
MNTNKSKIALLLAAGAVSMALTGCGGDDGNDGNPGNPGGPAANYINTLNLKVTDVTYTDGVPTINVFATNEEDLPVVGLTALEVKNVAQLIPQGATGAGNRAQWQPIGSQKQFEDQKNGNYRFTIDNIKVEKFNAELTQRYNVIASASTLADGATTVPRTEISQDFSGEGYDALYTKNIVSQQTCAKCHAEGEPLTRRHSTYINQESCATCHDSGNYGMEEEKHWNHLIHNIHNTDKIFESKGYVFDGEKAEALIQNNCKSCHVPAEEGEPELAEWGNWSSVPTMETCSSCHSDIDFKAGQGHSQQANNSNCIACHNASWTEEIHSESYTQTKNLINQYGIETSSTVDPTTKAATITIQVVDADGVALDINTIKSQIQRIDIMTNVGPNNMAMSYGKKDSITAVKNGVVLSEEGIVDGKLVYTTIKPLDFGAAKTDTDTAVTFVNWAMCSENDQFTDCNEVNIETNLATNPDSGNKFLKVDFFTGMKADMAFATLSGETASTRHVDSVNFGACANCHGTEWQSNYHKGENSPGIVMSEQVAHSEDANGNPIIGLDGCATCHTPAGTYAAGKNKGALEMKLHVKHSQGDYAVIKGMNCDQCHNDFNLDAFKKKDALATSVEGLFTPAQTSFYTTPIAATCGSCHSYNMDSFKTHVEGKGALVNVEFDELPIDADGNLTHTETCFFCHEPNPGDHTSMKM